MNFEGNSIAANFGKRAWSKNPSALNMNDARRKSASTLKDKKALDLSIKNSAKTRFSLPNLA